MYLALFAPLLGFETAGAPELRGAGILDKVFLVGANGLTGFGSGF